MSYRIRYEAEKMPLWKWTLVGAFAGTMIWFVAAVMPIMQTISAGEGLYDALARYVGGMILGYS